MLAFPRTAETPDQVLCSMSDFKIRNRIKKKKERELEEAFWNSDTQRTIAGNESVQLNGGFSSNSAWCLKTVFKYFKG